MKKIISTVISFALLISCIIFQDQSNILVAKAGTGENAKIESINDLAEFLTFFMDNDRNGANILFADDDTPVYRTLSTVKNNAKKSGVHESATITLTSSTSGSGNYSSSSTTSYTHSSSNRESSATMDREMTIYISKDSTLYETRGNIVSKSKSSSTQSYNDYYGSGYHINTTRSSSSSETAVSFSFKVLCIDDDCYINFELWDYVESNNSSNEISSSISISPPTHESYEKTMTLKPKNINTWIELPVELANDLLNINSSNSAFLSALGELISHAAEAKIIDEDERKFTMDENDIKKLLKKVEEDVSIAIDDSVIEFFVDYSCPETPYMSFYYDYYKTTSENNSISTQSSVNKISMSIKNIDNTVIAFDDDCVDIEVEDIEELEALFNIDEDETNS